MWRSGKKSKRSTYSQSGNPFPAGNHSPSANPSVSPFQKQSRPSPLDSYVAALKRASSEPSSEPAPELQLGFRTEPIVAWRVWQVRPFATREGVIENRLVPITQAGGCMQYTPFKRSEAFCSRADHDAPYRHCTCGIWALKDETLAQLGGLSYLAFGEVYLWGRVLEGEVGYRAQYAYPKRLFCADDWLAKELGQLYGVPAEVGSLPTFVHAYPMHLPQWTPSTGMITTGSGVSATWVFPSPLTKGNDTIYFQSST